jgi:S-adenosyl-L-methionine hydrolase (adenosine-forming)
MSVILTIVHMAARIITLTTDWGLKDHYVASVKGKLFSLVQQDILIVDISHQITPLRIYEAAFVLKNCMEFYPPGTIHIISVGSEASKVTPHVVVEYQERFFIGTDNGIFSLLFDKPDKAYEIEVYQDSDFFTFPTKDVFVKVAASIVNGEPTESVGPVRNQLNKGPESFKPADTPTSISGVVIHIDNYGNAITNITYEKFKRVVKNKPFVIVFKSYEIEKISHTYQDEGHGELLALFNSSGLLEIAQCDGHAANILGLSFNDMVKVFINE